MKYAALTDVGMKRKNNEDSYVVNCEDGNRIFIVADGMGGHNAGEVASLEACRLVEKYILENAGDIKNVLKQAVNEACRQLYIRASENEAMRGMGTTIDVCVATKSKILVAHVGDSRVYVASKDEMKKITSDHSVVGMMLDAGTITPEEAKNHPQRHFITRAVGASISVEVDIVEHELSEGDIVLMCTDGLTNMVPDEEIYNIIANAEDINEAAARLVERAKANGGDDNITVVLLCNAEREG